MEPVASDLSRAPDPAPVVGYEGTHGTQTGVGEPAGTDESSLSSDQPVQSSTANKLLRSVVEWVAVIVSALVFALVIKAYVVQAFEIPSPSMVPAVNPGDRILVNKLSYRVNDVGRGDLVVFARLEGSPGDTENLIKRAIGLPGETIEVRDDGRIWIWKAGESAEQALVLSEPYLDASTAVLTVPSERDSVTSDIWDPRCVNERTAGRCELGPNSYFMMGDNRGDSIDSRFFGPVPDENIVGRAFFRVWPLDELGRL